MDTDFLVAYKRLNDAQRAAVDAIDGPVLVIAGPGTGKTQLLSMRVANIMQRTDTDPSSILCLTFTNFAATNMRERLQRLVGPTAHNVMVRTFHSFAAEIMNDHPDYFWNGATLGIVPDTIQLEIIQDILGQLPLDNPLAMKFAGAYTAINDVQQALRLTKEAGLTPSKLAAMLAVNVAYINVIEPVLVELLSPALSIKKLATLAQAIDRLPDQAIDETVTPLASLATVIKTSLSQAIESDLDSGKTTQTGKWKRRWLQTVAGEKGLFDERRRNGWWQALVEVYERYREQLHARGFYDYADMIIEVITQLEQHPELLASVQEKYSYVLIDEFQDTNAAQLRLSYLVASSPSSEGKPNIMAVGDDDQSIFAFNGAELNNMLRFQQTYPTTQTIVLTDNYRSTQKLLDVATSIIEQADDRLVKRRPELTKHLRAAAPPPKSGIIEHRQYPTRDHELSSMATHVQTTWKADSTSSIAVLARNHDSLREISAHLNRLGVPISYEQQNNILDQPLVQQINLIAEIVVHISTGHEAEVNTNLARLLAHAAWGIDAETLWQLALQNRKDPHWLSALQKSSNKQLTRLADWLLWLAAEASQEPLAAVLEYIIGLRDSPGFSSPLHTYFVSFRPIDNSYLEALSGLRVLQGLVAEFIGRSTSELQLADYVRFIQLTRQHNRSLTDESWFVSGNNAVRLLTIHKAKGLEFDTVFLVDAVEGNWQPRRIGRKPPANLPLQPYGEQYDDYVRLAYVAATRARRSFIVSSHQTDTQGKALLPTPLIQGLPSVTLDTISETDSILALETALTWPRLVAKDEKALLSPYIAGYSLNATALLQFLDVTTGGPLHFLETQLLRLPQLTTVNMAYGTAIHRALQTAQLLTNSGTYSLKAVLKSYRTALDEQQITRVETERYRAHGEQVLTQLLGSSDFQLIRGSHPELSINAARLGEARIAGKLDRVDVNKDDIIISDYKTGTALTSFDTHDRTKVLKTWRHQTQLLFYTVLLRQSSQFARSKKTVRTQMIYVESEDPRSRILELQANADALQRLQQLIAVVWQHIMHLDFPDTSHYPQTLVGVRAFEDDLLNKNVKQKK